MDAVGVNERAGSRWTMGKQTDGGSGWMEVPAGPATVGIDLSSSSWDSLQLSAVSPLTHTPRGQTTAGGGCEVSCFLYGVQARALMCSVSSWACLLLNDFNILTCSYGPKVCFVLFFFFLFLIFLINLWVCHPCIRLGISY